MDYNVFADMGFENPEEERMKSEMISSLRTLIAENHLTSEQVSVLWSMEPSAVSELLRGHWGNYPLNQLLSFANALGGTFHITLDRQETGPGDRIKRRVLTS